MFPRTVDTETGATGVVCFGPILVGRLHEWRISQSGNGAILFADRATIKRFWLSFRPIRLIAYVLPDKAPYRLGRPKPPPPRPLRIAGNVYRLTATALTLNEASITAISAEDYARWMTPDATPLRP